MRTMTRQRLIMSYEFSSVSQIFNQRILKNFHNKKLYSPFPWKVFKSPKPAESIQEEVFFFTVLHTNLIDLGRMKGIVALGNTHWF